MIRLPQTLKRRVAFYANVARRAKEAQASPTTEEFPEGFFRRLDKARKEARSKFEEAEAAEVAAAVEEAGPANNVVQMALWKVRNQRPPGSAPVPA
jgi:hypothetical protein